MSSDNGNNPETELNLTPEPPPAPTSVDGNCLTCATPITIPAPPIVNFHNVVQSIIAIPHTKGINCAGCGQYYNIGVFNFAIQLGLYPQEKPELNEDSKIIPAKILPFK
jgi:hypothetical protein